MDRVRTIGYLAAAVISAWSSGAGAQLSPDAAHNEGLGLGRSELNRVGTGNINESNAQSLVPFSKDQPVQKNDSRTDANLFYEMGVNQINSSKTYSPGNCDREGFDPEAEARKGMGEDKWARLTEAQRAEAIANQKSFFDQECEGINFLAGSYPGRTEYEIQPGDDLGQWEPDTIPPDQPGACTTETLSTPASYDKFYCNESTAIEHRECYDTANVEVYYSPGLPVAPYTQTIYNHNSPRWDLTVYPADGLVHVVAPNGAIGEGRVCSYECWEGGGDAGQTYCGNRCSTQMQYGRQEQWISMYGGQTSIWQTYRANERFRVRSRPNDACVFRIDNWHYQGGAGPGPEDNHMTWTHNFCVPIKRVRVTWNNNCGSLDAAMNR